MYGNAFPSSSIQQQSQPQQQLGLDQTTGNAGAAAMNSNNGQFDFSNMMGMGMNGGLGGAASAGGNNGMVGGFSSLDGSMGTGNNINPALMFNPQLQALLQQQMAQQQSTLQPQQPQQQQVQQQQQPQQIRWPTMAQQTPMTNQAANLGYMQANQAGITPQNLIGNAAMLQQQPQKQQQQQTGSLPNQGAQFGQQPFNPFLQNQQQQSSQQMPVGQQSNFGAQASGSNMNNFAAAYLAQAQAQQQKQRTSGSSVPANMMNNASVMGSGGAGNSGMVDPNSIMQSAQYKAMQQAVGNGAIPSHLQMQQQSHMHLSPQLQNQTVPQPSPKSAITGTATPEPKTKGRPKGSTKKKKEEAARLLQQQQMQQQQQQQQQQMLLQGNFQSGAPFSQISVPSPAPSFQPTPTPSHASILSHASPSIHQPVTMQQQQQDRARSNTKSPNLSNPLAQTGSASFPRSVGKNATSAAAITNINGLAPRNVPPNWMPALSAAEQQQLLGQALSFSKAQSTKNPSGQQNPSPAHILMQLGYVYVKAAVLPNNGQGAGIPGNGASGAGAVLSINEARMIGILPQPNQSMANVPSTQQGSLLTQQSTFQQPQPSSSGSFVPQTSQGSAFPMTSLNPQANQQSQTMAPPTSQHLQMAHQQQQQQQQQQQGQPPSMSNVTPRLAGAAIPGSSLANMHHQGSPSPMGNIGKKIDGSIRARQASTSSRPDTFQGAAQMLGSDSPAQFNTNATGGPSSSSLQQHQQQQQQNQQQMMMQQMASNQSSRPGAASVTGPPLPPVEGGPMPKETPIGLEIAEYNTRLTPLPPSHILTSDASHSALEDLWKPLTKKEEEELVQIMGKDSRYTKMMNLQSQRNNAVLSRRLQELRPRIGGAGGWLHWWERGVDEDQSQLGKDGPFENFKILLPADKRNQRAALGIRSTSLPTRSTKQITLERQSASQFEEDLVPVRLELEHEGWILRDTFTWPAPESFKTEMIERFAVILCEDFGLPTSSFVSSIRENILSQVSDHTAAEAIRPMKSKRKRDECMGKGRLSEQDENWWKQWRIKLEEDDDSKEKITEMINIEDVSAVDQRSNSDSVDGITNNEPEAEMRIQIRIDVTVGAMNLVDHFEWDISDEGSSAEEFAAVFTADLGLSGEFRTAVAHSIREQVDVYIRSLALVGYTFDGKELLDDELREPLLGTINSIVRSQHEIDSYTPKLMQLSELEILHSEREREKESRRKRRQTRGRRGVNLPDREPLKTSRTPAVFGLQTGQHNLDSLNGISIDGIQNRQSGTVGGHAGPISNRGLAGMSTRRAAAAAANANIAPHSAGVYDHGTPTPQPENNHVTINGRKVPINAKKKKIESQATHFEFPGGLGRGEREEEEEADNRGPKFAPSIGSNRKMVEQNAELGNAPSKTSHLLPLQLSNNGSNLYNNHGTISTSTITTATSTGPVAWNMAKPEEAATQHPNWHDGLWHCSNCGVPGSLDTSRRKGPLGDKTLCGICGKFFHRHRKARPVDYTRDVAFHRRELAARGIFRSEVPVTRDDGGFSTQDQSTHESPNVENTGVEMEGVVMNDNAPKRTRPDQQEEDDDDDDEEEVEEGEEKEGQAKGASKTTSRGVKLESFPNTRGNSPDLPFEQVGSPDDSDSSDTSRLTMSNKKGQTKLESSRSISPDKPISSTSSIFAAQQQQQHQHHLHGSLHDSPSVATSPPSAMQSSSSINAPISGHFNSSISTTAPAIATTAPMLPSASGAILPPDWLTKACHTLRMRFPLDRFEVLLRPRQAGSVPSPLPEWRVRCQDCPGKLYTPGPEETLTNFEIHLKNRAHRANVQKAVQIESRKPYGS